MITLALLLLVKYQMELVAYWTLLRIAVCNSMYIVSIRKEAQAVKR